MKTINTICGFILGIFNYILSLWLFIVMIRVAFFDYQPETTFVIMAALYGAQIGALMFGKMCFNDALEESKD